MQLFLILVSIVACTVVQANSIDKRQDQDELVEALRGYAQLLQDRIEEDDLQVLNDWHNFRGYAMLAWSQLQSNVTDEAAANLEAAVRDRLGDIPGISEETTESILVHFSNLLSRARELLGDDDADIVRALREELDLGEDELPEIEAIIESLRD